MLVLAEGGNLEKPLEQGLTNSKLRSRNLTQATVVGGERTKFAQISTIDLRGGLLCVWICMVQD